MSATPFTITVADVVALNAESVTREGGTPDPPKTGCVEGSVGAAEMAEFYSGTGDGTLGLCFIGSLMFYIIKNHCFVDGNKRTGLAVALKALYILGLTLDVTPDELRDYCLAIADNQVTSSENVVLWLSEHLVADN
jgi:death on curing protein